MSKEQFYKKTKGTILQNDDWYSYETHNGKIVITHTWSHYSPSSGVKKGSKEYTLEDFYKSQDVDTKAKVALKKKLESP